jgi:prepilin peptidase CpaA
MNAVSSDSFFGLVAYGVLLFGTSVAATIDVKTRRIPNALCAALAVAGVTLHVPQGIGIALLAVVAMLLGLAAGWLVFSAGWLGGGDVKLISACCAVVGFSGSFRLVLDILIAGALLSLVTAALRRKLGTLLRGALIVARHGAGAGAAGTVPYGVAIAAGSFAYTFLALASVLRPV